MVENAPVGKATLIKLDEMRCNVYKQKDKLGWPTTGIVKPMMVADLAEDYEVAAVPNYLEGLSALKRLNPEMVIVNVSLPLIDGWEACRELSRDFGLPVMLLGRNGGDAGWEKAFDAGADFYLKTPFSKLEILSRIKAILRRTCRSNHPSLPRR